MTDWLLDTNVLSGLRRLKPEPNVLAFVAGQSLDRLYVSGVTFAEIRFGIEIAVDASVRAQLNEWLTNRIRPMFDGRTLAVSEDVMFKWRLLVEEGRKARHTFSQPDLIIAATALPSWPDLCHTQHKRLRADARPCFESMDRSAAGSRIESKDAMPVACRKTT